MFRNPTTDLIVILVIVLLIFGPKRLPGMGKQLGQGIREFKDGITGKDDDKNEGEAEAEAERPALSESTATPAAPANTPTTKTEAERTSAEVGSEQRS